MVFESSDISAKESSVVEVAGTDDVIGLAGLDELSFEEAVDSVEITFTEGRRAQGFVGPSQFVDLAGWVGAGVASQPF